MNRIRRLRLGKRKSSFLSVVVQRHGSVNDLLTFMSSALSTSAAPYYFKPFRRGIPIREYADGALHADLPVAAALKEMKKLWPLTTTLDALVSVGTGIQDHELQLPNVARIGGFEAVCKTFFNNLNTEATWKDFTGEQDYSPTQHHRLNVPIRGEYIGLDDYKAMPRMLEAVNLRDGDRVHHRNSFASTADMVAERLKASLLFFEPDPSVTEDESPFLRVGPTGYEIRGTIRCRLCKQSESLGLLVDNIESLMYCQQLGTKTCETDIQVSWTKIKFLDTLRKDVRTSDAWLRIPCILKTHDKDSEHTVAVRLRRPVEAGSTGPNLTAPIPISGFPVTFRDLETKARQRWNIGD